MSTKYNICTYHIGVKCQESRKYISEILWICCKYLLFYLGWHYTANDPSRNDRQFGSKQSIIITVIHHSELDKLHEDRKSSFAEVTMICTFLSSSPGGTELDIPEYCRNQFGPSTLWIHTISSAWVCARNEQIGQTSWMGIWRSSSSSTAAAAAIVMLAVYSIDYEGGFLPCVYSPPHVQPNPFAN